MGSVEDTLILLIIINDNVMKNKINWHALGPAYRHTLAPSEHQGYLSRFLIRCRREGEHIFI